MYIDNPKKNIEVYRWRSIDKIDSPIKIDFIYQDDQIEVGIKKLLTFFNLKDIYVWTDDEIVEFDTSVKLNNINPFNFDTSQDIKKLKITGKKGIFNYQKINIVDKDIFKDDKIILNVFFKYLRPNINVNEKKLNEIYQQPKQCEIVSTIITNFEFDANIELEYTLKYYYRKLNNDFDVIAWIYDNYNKHFTVKSNKDYTDIIKDLEKTQYIQEELILVKYLSYFKSYYSIEIMKDGKINVKLFLGNKLKYNIQDVLKLKEQISEYLFKLFDKKIILEDKTLKSQIELKTPNFSLDLFIKQSSLIYNFVSKQDKIYIYNRTSSNTESYDIENYIRELYKNSITKNIDSIVSILSIQLNDTIDTEDLKDLVTNTINNEEINLTKTRKIYFTRKTFFTIRKVDKIYISIIIDNIKSLIELNYFIFWLSRVTYNSIETKKEIQVEKSSLSDDLDNDSPEPLEDDSTVKSKDSLDGALSSSGGMGKKDADIKQLNHLQTLDPQLFNKKDLYNNKTYAQTCQGNRQPMGLPKDKFQKYVKNVDNYLEINNNIYFCPRYWCLTNEQPILDKKTQTCDNGEEPIDLYATKKGTFNKPDTPHYVNYYSKDYPKPCCYLKNKQIIVTDTIKEDKPKDEKISAHSASNTHICTTYNTLPENRYGTLPKSILKIIDNKAPGLVCNEKQNTKLKSKKCAFRMGIPKKNRDLMDILTIMFNYKKRYDLVKAIYNKLDLVKFISLENGEIVREFMKIAFYKNYKKIDNTVLQRNYEIKISPASRKNIDYAFNAYIDYLRYDNVDNPHYLYSVIALVFKCNMYIWKYKNNSNFYLLNPLYSSYNDIRLLSESENAINIFHNGNLNLFEPIVLKSTTKLDYIFDFSSKNYDNLRQLYISSKIDNSILQKIKEYTAFFKSNKDEFKIQEILLNNNLTVNHLLLNNNKILKLNTFIEPILLNRLIDITNVNKISLYDEYYYNKNFNLNFINYTEIKNKYNFDIIFGNLKQQRFDNSILFYNTVILENETKYNNELDELVDNIYKTKNYNNKIFKDEIKNHHNFDDWYNSYNFNNIFMTDKIQYLKGKLAFSNKAINEYIKLFVKSYKTEIIKLNKNIENIKDEINIKSKFIKGELKSLPSKWNSYKLHYVDSLNYNNDTIYEFLIEILKQDKTKEIKDLTIKNTEQMFGSLDSFYMLCYILDFKSIISKELQLTEKTNIDEIYGKLKKKSKIEEEKIINKIIKKFKTSEIDLYSVSELFDIVIIVMHSRTYHSLKKTKEKIIRNSIEDIGATCNMFINSNIRKDYNEYPLLIVYSDKERLYFINNGYYNKVLDVNANIKEIIKYKLKTYKDLN